MRMKVAKEAMDMEAGKLGLVSVEALLFAKLMEEIGATDEKGNKVLAYLHLCETLNSKMSGDNCGSSWISKLPKRFPAIKKRIQATLKKINAASDARTGLLMLAVDVLGFLCCF
jgi:hypothetical protein